MHPSGKRLSPSGLSHANPIAHTHFMKAAIAASFEKMREGNGGPFGAVLVFEGNIIATGHNQVTSTNDPTAHAEIVAIRCSCQALSRFSLSGCTLYTSCEPCPMCLSAIYWARLDHVYFANTRADAAAVGFDDDFIYQQVPLPPNERTLPMSQIMRDDALKAFLEWNSKTDKIPY